MFYISLILSKALDVCKHETWFLQILVTLLMKNCFSFDSFSSSSVWILILLLFPGIADDFYFLMF